jgi:putative transposase
MDDVESLNHTKWECKYHVIFIPKYRKKVILGKIRPDLAEVVKGLATHKASRIETGSLQVDHVHMVISIPPKYLVSQVVGYIKGKSAIHVARRYGGKGKNFTGESFWARGYYVSTVGKDEKAIKEYVEKQEKEDTRIDQMKLFK